MAEDVNAYENERQAVEKVHESRGRIERELSKVIVGQKDATHQLLISLFAGGHCLITGAPGLAKTLLVRTIAQVFHLKFQRIQFTPDLMPADITGTEILEETSEGRRRMQFVKGPIFANVILADEINRTPPKTQAALLEAMQEHQVTAAGVRYPLEEPFFVLATQNPIEMEGTYPLPEAQLDRFMFNVIVDYLPEDEEVAVVQQTTSRQTEPIQPLFDGRDVLQFHDVVRKVPIAEDLVRYAVRLSSSSRPGPEAPDFVKQWVSWGAGLRAAQSLVLGAKARALLRGRFHVEPEDIRALVHPTLAPSYSARLSGRGRWRWRRFPDRSTVRACQGAQALMPSLERQGASGFSARRRDDETRAGSDLIDPQALMRIKSLQVRARVAVEGFIRGIHRSPYHGFSVEFSEYREYTPGDDPRYLDWRLFARSDRYYVKRFEDETNLRCYLVVDTSRSMGYRSIGYDKSDYARTAAATIAHFLAMQRDAVGLMLFEDRITEYLPARYRPGHLRRLMAALDREPAGRATDIVGPLEEIAATVRKRGLIILISDVLAPTEALQTRLGYLRSRGHDVVVLRVLDPAEMDFPIYNAGDVSRCRIGQRYLYRSQCCTAGLSAPIQAARSRN